MVSIRRLSNYITDLYPENGEIKILHFNAENSKVKNELKKSGYTNYLGFTKNKGKEKAATDLYYTKDGQVAYKNNADLVILNDSGFLTLINSFRSSVETIIYKPANKVDIVSFLPVMAYLILRKKKWDFHYEYLLNEHEKKDLYITFNRKYQKEKATRHYLSPEMSLDNFFNRLNEKQLKYVILRWFDEIPFENINEDIDLLVSDNDIEEIQGIMNERVGILPFDIYSCSGLSGSDFKNMAYYPPYLAEHIIGNRELWNGKYYIPNKKNHLLSLMYHAVYHKGEKSGIPVERNTEGLREATDHDYIEVLQKLAHENNIIVKEWTLKYLHSYLNEEGWAPATDTLRKLGFGKDEWAIEVASQNNVHFEKKGEVMVFVIRDWTVRRGLANYITDWLEKEGLNIVKEVILNPEERRNAAQKLRGGNWGKGPWPVSGGDPAAILVVYDYHPKPLNARMQKKYPHVSNEKYLLKEKIRKEINDSLPKLEQTNIMHSADDEIESMEYIMAVCPQIMEQLKETIGKWDKNYSTKEIVIADVSEHKRRAKVEVIDYQGKKAVKKTYKAQRERFLNREKYVYGELSKECEFIPALIESGDNYIIIPYFETVKFSSNPYLKNRMLRKYKKEILAISEFFYQKGYALIDFHPGNLLITKNGLKVIDFEFLYQYENVPKSSRDSFDLIGFPDDFQEDKPLGIKGEYRKKIWKRILN